MKKPTDELSEDMEVVGPGLMLSEARTKLSLSIEDVAEKLKFRKSLVRDIEQDIFNQELSSTYNRGYLRSYAKLVKIDIDEVLSAYDMLGIAEVQRSEMQSFSNLTEKQAEHSRLMWFSYFIVVVLFSLMVLWWMQEATELVDEKAPQTSSVVTNQDTAIDITTDETTTIKSETLESLNLDDVNEELDEAQAVDAKIDNTQVESTQRDKISTEPVITHKVAELNVNTLGDISPESSQVPVAVLGTAIFTFSGDCWVNIYDATGERLAWGVKKLGYVMTITGKTPLKVTLGKPELASIAFNGQSIDMSAFNVGNIAKFTLPLSL